jgi:uncharacterized protein
MNELYIEGYASRFYESDLNDDVVAKGAFKGSLMRTGVQGVKMFYQHDFKTPIGIWDDLYENALGLFVSGRILDVSPTSRLVANLVRAGILDGLSIGFRTLKARKSQNLRILTEIELWEISLVTFPMLATARLVRTFDAALAA